MDEIILRFFRDVIGGILITDENGKVLYADEKTSFIRQEKTNWRSACPPPAVDQGLTSWDLLRSEPGKTYLVLSSTFEKDGRPVQIHHLVDTSLYTELYRDISDYSKLLKMQKALDGLTGLFNKGRFLELRQSLFRQQETLAVFNMDVNNLKQMNDIYGHEAGDLLIKKAAASLTAIAAQNVLPFRIGGDEFLVVALYMTREEAEALRHKWEEALTALNREDDGIPCVIACGFAYGEKGYDLDRLLALADQRMYEDKKSKKMNGRAPDASPVSRIGVPHEHS